MDQIQKSVLFEHVKIMDQHLIRAQETADKQQWNLQQNRNQQRAIDRAQRLRQKTESATTESATTESATTESATKQSVGRKVRSEDEEHQRTMRLQSKREAADKKKPSDAFGKHVSVFGWFRDQGISSLSLYVCTYLQPSLPHSHKHSHKLYTSAIRVFSSLSSNKAKNAAATGSLIRIQYFILFCEKRIHHSYVCV
jgi:hypothetical protein